MTYKDTLHFFKWRVSLYVIIKSGQLNQSKQFTCSMILDAQSFQHLLTNLNYLSPKEKSTIQLTQQLSLDMTC